MKVISETHRVH